MIEKTHGKGERVVIHDPTDSPMLRKYNGKPGTIMSTYGLHTAMQLGVQFWGYFVRMDTGEIIGVSRRLLRLAELTGPRRGDMDRIVSWKDCPWQPQGV